MTPIIRREVLGLLRKRRTFWLLTLAVALSGLLPLAAWPEAAFGGKPDTSDAIRWLFLTQLAAALCLLPAFAAGAFAGERERGTYDLLFTTKLTPGEIVRAKAAAPLGCVSILVLATAPNVCVLQLLGGISFATILRCYLVTFAAVVVGALVCLVRSLRAKSTAQAVAQGFLWLALWSSGPVMLPAVVTWFSYRMLSRILADVCGLGSPEKDGDRRWSRLIHDAFSSWRFLVLFGPMVLVWFGIVVGTALFVVSLFSLVLPGFSPFILIAGLAKARQEADAYLAVYIGYAFLVGFGHLRILFREAGAPETRRLDAFEAWNAAQTVSAEALDQSPAYFSPRSLFTRATILLGERGIAPFRNPVFLKEVQTIFHGGVEYRRGLFLGSVGLFCLLGAMGGVPLVFAGATGFAILILPAVAAPAFTREAELGNLDLLRATLLSAREVLGGKLLAAIASVSGIIAAVVWVLAGMAALSRHDTRGLNLGIETAMLSSVVLAATIAFVAAYSTFAPVVSRRSLPALLLAYAPLIAFYAGLPLAIGLSGWEVTSDLEQIDYMNPFRIFDDLANRGPRHGIAAGYVVKLAVLHAGAAAVLWYLSWIRLERFGMRDR